ncbi:MAG: long-chain fatty acid--CoA ligase, partial [Actinobacteria bacterium]
FKVQPETVRRALLRHPAVTDAVVVGVDDARLGQVPVAVVEVQPGAALDEAELLASASEHLAPYEVPSAVRIVNTLPRTASAKVELSEVRARLRASMRAQT